MVFTAGKEEEEAEIQKEKEKKIQISRMGFEGMNLVEFIGRYRIFPNR